jgi:chromosomal replication initiator protein
MNPQQAWQAAIGQLQMEMPPHSFNTWVRNAELVSHQKNIFTVGVQNGFARDWLESRLTSTVTHLLGGLMEQPQKVDFIVYNRDNMPDEDDDEINEAETAQSIAQGEFSPTINSRYTFDTFVVGASNRLAHAACMAVAENPARAYNPLFLYGGVGLGKTHLLHAIGNLACRQGLKVLYVSSEEFTNDFISSVRSQTPMAFRERYRQSDLLMIDDIQFIIGKESTQEEFFHTFNTLHSQNKQIVITSDRTPKAMSTLEERMRSRFEWGLIADIQPPDLETRIAVLRAKAERNPQGVEVPNEILELIARQIQSNIRELEGALTRVLAYAHLTEQALTTRLVNTALADLLPKQGSLEPAQVLETVTSEYKISMTQLLGRDRSQEISLPRQVAMYLLREDVSLSLPQIGETLGGRDHTTIMHGCEKIADLIERDDRLRRQVIHIRERLYGAASRAV